MVLIWALTPNKMEINNICFYKYRINLISKGIKHCFSTGNWSIFKNTYVRTGVSQILNRLSYSGFISHLRRVNTPLSSSAKVRAPHQLHLSSIGVMCPYETPDGAKHRSS